MTANIVCNMTSTVTKTTVIFIKESWIFSTAFETL